MIHFMAWFPLFSAGLVVLGWFVALRNSKRLAARSETHALIASVLGVLDAHEAKVHDFWIDAAKRQSISIETHVSSMIQRIESVRLHLRLIEKRGIVLDHAMMLYKLRRVSTLNAEGVARMAAREHRERVEDISRHTRELKEAVYSKFLHAYSPL